MASIAGWSAATNQSDTRAAHEAGERPAARSPATAASALRRSAGSSGPGASARHPGGRVGLALPARATPAATARTAQQDHRATTASERSCGCAGECTYAATLGSTSAAVASTSRIEIVRARLESNLWVPCRRPPTTNDRPSTSRMLARIEPMMAAWTTAISPACSAKKPMNSSGRLPSALCSTPVAPAPKRSPSWSTLRPTSEANRATATAATTNGSTEPTCRYRVSPASTTATALPPSTTRSDLDSTRNMPTIIAEIDPGRWSAPRVAAGQPARLITP